MIKALIITPYRRYEFEIPAEHYSGQDKPGMSKEARAHDWLEDQIYGVTEGYIELPGQVIDIRHPNDVRSIEVWEEAPQLPTAGLPNLANLASLNISDEGPGELTGELTYLGQSVILRLITYRLRGYFYALPQEINHTPALETLDHQALGNITEQLLQREGVGGTVVLPPVQLDSDQLAGEYVMDYAEQATPPAHFSPAMKTARAYGGIWNDK